MRNSPLKSIQFLQLELPLFPKLKRNQKVKIKGLDSEGEYPNLVGKFGIIFAIANNGIWVRFPGYYLGRTKKRKVKLILLYSIWNIEYN
jgi:hypothetical protein